MMLREALGAELREVRKNRSMTLRQVATGALVSFSYISEIEAGKKEASSELLAAICGSLNVPMSDLMFGATEKLARTETGGLDKRQKRVACSDGLDQG